MTDVRSITRRDAVSMAIAGVVALILGPIVTLLGAVFLFGLILGPILILGGLVAMGVGGIGLLFPMTHSAVRKLGASGPEREAMVRAIDAELASSVIAQYRLSSGAVLVVTPSFFVMHGSGVILARREDLLWAYSKVTTHTRYGFTTGRTNELCFVTRQDERTVGSRGPEEAAPALALFSMASPRAFVGYRDELAALGSHGLAAQVDRIPFQPGGAPSAPGAAASPFAPGGPLGAVPGQPFAPGAAGGEPAPPSSAWGWALAIVGGLLSAFGVLVAFFFAWVALNPHEARDTQYGSFFALFSLVVCAGPGVVALGFGLFRLYQRYAK
ncbi:MAG: DUF6709 family protein [Sandaracinus sp.]